MATTSWHNGRHTTTLLLLLSAIGLIDLASHTGEALSQITPSGSTRAVTENNTTVITGGTRAGKNLFHSFMKFSVEPNAIAQFHNSGIVQANSLKAGAAPPCITNIFARVTGGQASQIDGTIQTVGFGKANLWFMNPSGITFGSNAQLDIGGSAVFTTASRLAFTDSKTFSAKADAQNEPLSISRVTEFGFFSPHSAIRVVGSTLEVPAGQTLSLVGGDISITGGHLLAPGGVRIAAVPTGATVVRNPESGAHVSVPQGNHVVLGARGPGNDAIISTGSTGELQINGATYGGVGRTGFLPPMASNGQPATGVIAIKIQDGSILVGNAPRISSALVANQPRTRLLVSSPVVVTLEPKSTSLTVAHIGKLEATLNDAFASPVDIKLRSINTNVASVTPPTVIVPAGEHTAVAHVQGIAPGQTSVTATVGTSSANVQVDVKGPSIYPLPLPPHPPTLAPLAPLLLASDRCSGHEDGMFSSFVSTGRDTARPQPGGLLKSPPYFSDDLPPISELSVQPALRAAGSLNVLPNAMAFLQRNSGC
jgi:filamentous hemagglutinin family protein